MEEFNDLNFSRYRIYDGSVNKMYPVKVLTFDELTGRLKYIRFDSENKTVLIPTLLLSCGYALLCSIGRKDKDGIDIYTGDIVEFCYEEQDLVGEVFYSEQDSAFEIIVRFGEVYNHSNFFLFTEGIHNISAIGDIYRSPILLEKNLGY